MKLGGWTPVGDVPDVAKAVFVAAPHTSNWDGYWALVYKVAVGLDIRFFAKASLFWFPLGALLKGLGGIPLDRNRAAAAVKDAVAMFEREAHFFFGLAPEGTRGLTDGWKTGFYRIAEQAGVPVYLGFLDYRSRRIGIGPRLDLSGDAERDLSICREFYANIEGRQPQNASPVVFRR